MKRALTHVFLLFFALSGVSIVLFAGIVLLTHCTMDGPHPPDASYVSEPPINAPVDLPAVTKSTASFPPASSLPAQVVTNNPPVGVSLSVYVQPPTLANLPNSPTKPVDPALFNDDLAKILVNYAAFVTIILSIGAVVAGIWGIVIGLRAFETFARRVRRTALTTATAAVGQLEDYIAARADFTSSYDVSVIAWDWENEYRQTPLHAQLAPIFFRRSTSALKKFQKLVADAKTGETYRVKGQELLGNVLINLVFFTCKDRDPAKGIQVVAWAKELEKQVKFHAYSSMFHTHIYARIVYPAAFAADRPNAKTEDIIGEVEKDLRSEESKGKEINEEDREEIARLKDVLRRRLAGEQVT